MKNKYIKRNLNSQQFQNLIFKNKIFLLSSIFKTSFNNLKFSFITKSSCIFLKDLLKNSFLLKFPIFCIRLKEKKTLDLNYLLQNLLSNTKIKDILIFLKIFNNFFLNFKEPLLVFSFMSIIKFIFLTFTSNILKISIFSFLYV